MLMEVWHTSLVAGNEVRHVVLFTAVLLTGFIVSKLLHLFANNQLKRWTERSNNGFDDELLEALGTPLYYLALGLTVRTAFEFLVLPEFVGTLSTNAITVVITVFIAWGITRVMDAVRVVFVMPFVEASETKLDDQLVPIADRTLKAVVWCLAILIVFGNLGYDILSLLTGLGIGGLAVAMAAQATLSNLLGSVTIFADQPFQVDDLITVSDHQGVVTDVGLRAVRVKTFEGYTVTIPNASVVSQPVVNHTVDGQWRHAETIGLTYDTGIDGIEQAIALLRGILDDHPSIHEAVVRFTAFADSALELTFIYFVDHGSLATFLDIQSDVNLAIKRQFDEAGLDMAFPTITLDVPASLLRSV